MSGYELKRFFQTTPAAVYQPGSGSLYPALRRLEERGLLRADEAPAGGRSRRTYRVTASARAATRRWVAQPVDPSSVAQDLGLHLMRFVLMEAILPRAEVRAFLDSLAGALAGFVEGMETYAAANPSSARHPGLALEHGIAVHRASLDWVRSARRRL